MNHTVSCRQIGFTRMQRHTPHRSLSLFVLGYIAVSTLAVGLTILISANQGIA